MTNGKTDVSFKNIIAIGGFIILLIIGVWSAIQVISYIPRLFSDADTPQGGNAAAETIVVATAADTATSGEPLAVTWERTTSEGVLSFSYACQDGFYFEIAGEPVPCNLAHTLAEDATELQVTPVLVDAGSETLTVPFAITLTDDAGESIRDTHTITVQAAAAGSVATDNTAPTTTTDSSTDDATTGTTSTPDGLTITPSRQNATQNTTNSTQQSYTAQYTGYSDPNGTPDLAVSLVSVGFVDGYGIYRPATTVQPNQRGAFVFAVTNRGTKATGPWYFNAQLPIQGGYPLFSEAQTSLLPGARVEIRIAFDQIRAGTQYFSVVADPRNFIREQSEYNNTVTGAFTVGGHAY